MGVESSMRERKKYGSMFREKKNLQKKNKKVIASYIIESILNCTKKLQNYFHNCLKLYSLKNTRLFKLA